LGVYNIALGIIFFGSVILTDSAPDRPIVCIFGSYSPQPGHEGYDQAYAIGKALAEAGFDVCNGGYDGTMLASAHGAKDGGGSTIGVTCDIFGSVRGKSLEANPFIDREIAHTDLLERIREMLDLGVAYVILPGGTGTMAELAIVWEYVAKKLIEHRPIFVVGDYWKAAVETVMAHRPKHGRCIHFVDRPEQIVEILRPG
jgi:hypothetical protein